VLDVMMPGENGLDLARGLRSASDVPILMLTARGDTDDRIAGLERGADDYLAKPFEPRELMLRLSALVRRRMAARPPVNRDIRMGACIFDSESGELRREGRKVKLTGSETQLLKLLAANPGYTFTREQLCTRLGIALERSIDVQVTRLRRKIEEDPKIPLHLQTIRGAGYVLVPDRA
jgi:two-component system, OmpR family, phosphate regulon response regulator OmpR